MATVQIIHGTQIKIGDKVYKCIGHWALGNSKITRYIFETKSGEIFTRTYQYVQDCIANKIIEKI